MKFFKFALPLALALSTQGGVEANPLPIGERSVAAAADLAASTHELVARAPTTDAAFTVATSTVNSAITCPNGIAGRTGGVILLVHGTGQTGQETWANGPYVSLLPNYSPGYDVCYVTLPSRSWQDAQTSSEYVARAVQILAPKSKTGTVSIIGHSQGNINIQWALSFWPSIRPKVHQFVSLAGDFKGTLLAYLGCAANDLLAPGTGCQPSVLQQASNSRYLRVLKNAAGSALVKTLSLSTAYDEVVVPQSGTSGTSYLPGATNVQLQQSNICGALHPAGHISMTIDPAAFELAYETIRTGTTPMGSTFDKWSCFNFFFGTGYNNNTFAKTADALQAAFQFALGTASYPTTKTEPAIRSYAQAYL
ncbi:uncharacterized protein PFL1_04936 [Pseudozyma flocculosa PF-1]|uniref:Alpha/beta-hydrolase n=2 Tax=Pseudozyma flocculosa TaxID=84751 RepID=A0A5C3EVA4_9BASI|nr:uncharacterized protein PFL1_04936 [Pseudozyma flocculosa PF-1]EPQ27398.1 hypothetical protein PFL1_04936 [Pseudozyma flocculosa PF-1]SPO36184.1 uncharacterized protein PSFLO_01655 [Pseudozyma flocculosa]